MHRPWSTPETIALVLALAPGAQGCLPGDTRPPPESVYTTAEPSQALAAGFDTADGWHIGFDRFLLAIGNVDLEEDDASCNRYAEARYDRLFDFTVSGREKVGTVYGLGTCGVGFRLRQPSTDALLGPGVSASDVALMRQRATNRFVDDEGASLIVIGAGTLGETTRRFEWVFRRSFKFIHCEREGGGFATTFELTEGGAAELRIEVRAEELFRSLPDDGAELRFQPIADADADADGLVTLDELAGVSLPTTAADGGTGSLEQLVYEQNLPRVLRVVGSGPCEAQDRSRR